MFWSCFFPNLSYLSTVRIDLGLPLIWGDCNDHDNSWGENMWSGGAACSKVTAWLKLLRYWLYAAFCQHYVGRSAVTLAFAQLCRCVGKQSRHLNALQKHSDALLLNQAKSQAPSAWCFAFLHEFRMIVLNVAGSLSWLSWQSTFWIYPVITWEVWHFVRVYSQYVCSGLKWEAFPVLVCSVIQSNAHYDYVLSLYKCSDSIMWTRHQNAACYLQHQLNMLLLTEHVFIIDESVEYFSIKHFMCKIPDNSEKCPL